MKSQILPEFKQGIHYAQIQSMAISVLEPNYDQTESASLIKLLLLEVLGIQSFQLPLYLGQLVENEVYNKFNKALLELQNNKPLQYILGKTEFYGLPLKIDERALIPRPETEELVNWVLNDYHKSYLKKGPVSILDIGTGSGAIALALKYSLPSSNVSAMDISSAALELAVDNALFNHLEVEFFKEDILNPYAGVSLPNYDYIISNPPYISIKEKIYMNRNVIDFEPSIALFVPDEDPLCFYIAIARFAIHKLKVGGKLFLEINEVYSKETIQVLIDAGFKNPILKNDLNNRARMICAEKTDHI